MDAERWELASTIGRAREGMNLGWSTWEREAEGGYGGDEGKEELHDFRGRTWSEMWMATEVVQVWIRKESRQGPI
jgi:hypothetical protein